MSTSIGSTASSGIQLSGLASGIDWTSIVNELLQIESAPETLMQSQQTTAQNKSTAYQGISTQLTALQNDIKTFNGSGFFDSRAATSSNQSVATATAANGTAQGNFTFKISQLATDAVQQGKSGIAAPLSPTDSVATLEVGSAGFANPVTPGTFTVNGQTITVAATDTLQSVFDQINTKTGVTATYSNATDEITLTGSGTAPVVLGSATDTSNFLQAAELFNNGTTSVTSAAALGGVNLNNPMSQSNLATPITGSGSFTINGVQISYDSSADSINDVLGRINDSAAGVTATYDSINNRFLVTDKTTGDVGISLSDNGTGNFLAATGLTPASGGALQRGQNLLYTVNGGGQLVSQSNTISAASSGITGLTVTATDTTNALSNGVTITVGTDTSKISSAISQFVTDYNSAQNFIHTQIATTTSSTGTVTPGVLTGDLDAEGISDQLRHLANVFVSGATGDVHSLMDMGITSNGQDNTLSLDTTALNAALANNLGDIKNVFTNATNGIATSLDGYLTTVNGVNGLGGMLSNDEDSMTKQINDIQTSINALQQRIGNDKTRLTAEFTAMETAIQGINTQKQFLNQQFGGSSTSTNAAPAAAGSNINSSSTG